VFILGGWEDNISIIPEHLKSMLMNSKKPDVHPHPFDFIDLVVRIDSWLPISTSQVILVGGSTRIPAVQNLAREKCWDGLANSNNVTLLHTYVEGEHPKTTKIFHVKS